MKYSIACVLAALSLLALASCTRDRLGSPDGGGADVEQISRDLDEQISYHQQLAGLAAVMDTAAAMDSVASMLSRHPDVDWAVNGGTQVNILWKSGVRGFLLLRAGGRRSSSPGSPMTPHPEARAEGHRAPSASRVPGADPAASPAAAYTIPKHRKSIYLAPCYTEFRVWDDDLLDAANQQLPKAGYDPFTVVKEQDASLERFRAMDEGQYGVIRLSTHGAAYPDNDNVQHVYYLSGEIVTPESTARHAESIQSGLLGVTSYYDENRFSFCAPYLAGQLNFGDSSPLVLLGLCYGYLGGWEDLFRGTAKAGAVMGWDWEVDARIDAGKMRHLFMNLCDTTLALPWTLQHHYRTITPYYMEGSRQITLHYAAADSFALWKPGELTITRIDPNTGAPGDYVFITGEDLGTTPGVVRFGSIPSTTFGYWTNTTISVQVPQGLPGGIVPVTVSVGGKTSNPLDFFYEDALFDALHASWYMDFYLLADHTWEPWDAGEDDTFAQLLQPIVWDGVNFSGVYRETNDSQRRRITFQGSVGADGRTLALEYEAADTTVNALGRTETYKKARIVGLPFDDFYSGTTHYQATSGEAVQGHVQELVWRRRSYNHGGGITEISDYVSTSWGSAPHRNRLQVIFH